MGETLTFVEMGERSVLTKEDAHSLHVLGVGAAEVSDNPEI